MRKNERCFKKCVLVPLIISHLLRLIREKLRRLQNIFLRLSMEREGSNELSKIADNKG
ncbi:MAG: hypothetical protein AB1393_11355 [Candidatus Edwardsbacteria bacterium]